MLEKFFLMVLRTFGTYNISVTPTLPKVFERLLLQQMLEQVEKYELINKSQFGFPNRKFFKDTVISLTESVNCLFARRKRNYC